MILTLVRDLDDGTATLGLLTAANFTCHTIERPWKDNAKGVSCVPVGTYTLQRHDSEAHHDTWALVNRDLGVLHYPDASLPDARTACLIHPANWAYELRGCIAPGMTRVHTEQWMVTRSREAFNALMDLLPFGTVHTLEIAHA